MPANRPFVFRRHHPQSTGRLERVHETLMARLNLLVHVSPELLRTAQESRTLARRVRYDRAAAMPGTRGELTCDLSVPQGLTESQRC